MRLVSRAPVVAFLAAGVLSAASLAGAEPAANEVSFLADLHFTGPAGGDVVVPAADYRVEAGDDVLQLVPAAGGDALVVAAARKAHDEKLDAPVAIVESGDSEETQDLLYLALALPDGVLLEATGSVTGVVSRGLGDKWKNRPRPVKKLVANVKETVATAVTTRADLEAKGFDDGGSPSDPDDYTRLQSSRATAAPYLHAVPDVPATVELDAQPDARATLRAQTLLHYDCESAFGGRQKTGENVQLFGQCRLYVKNGTSRVKLWDYVESPVHGSASQTFEWLSSTFHRPGGGTVDLTLTLGVTGKLQSFGINSAAGLELSAFVESRAKDSADPWVVGATDKWSARAEAASAGVGVDAGPVSFGVSGYASAPLWIDEDVLFLLSGLDISPTYEYRVRVRAKAEATTGIKPLALVAAPPVMYSFPTQANFHTYVRGSTRKDYGLAWKSLVITTN